MGINPTYRLIKGSPLTWSELDDNFRQISDQAVTQEALSSPEASASIGYQPSGGLATTVKDALDQITNSSLQLGIRVDRAILSYPDYASAESAAPTLPDGQEIEAPDATGKLSIFEVQSGTLEFQDYLPDSINLQSYSELRSYTGKAQSVEITTPGISGRFNLDSSDTSTADNGGTVIVGSDGRRWKRYFSGPAYIKWFGAVGDGVSNDTLSVQSAISYAVSSKVGLRGSGGSSYIVTSQLIADGSIDLDLFGDIIDGRTIPAGVTFNEVSVLKIQGNIGSNISVTSDIPVGSNQISLTSTSGFSNGDYLLLSSDQLMVDGYGNPGNLRGELNRVELVNSGSLLSTSGDSLFSYSSASNAKVQKITPAFGVKVRNGRILAGGIGSWHSGLQLHYCVGFLVEDLDVVGGEDVGVSTFYCYGGLQRGGRIEDSTNPDGGMASDSGTGYGSCLYNATRDVIITGVSYRNCKRAITGGARYPSVFNTTRNCVSEGGRNGFGTHEPCWWWTVEDNTVRGMTGVGINVRGQFNKIHRNKLFDCAGFGIQVRTFYVNPLGLRGAELVDNYMERTAGILLDGDATDGRVVDATVSGGEIRDAIFNNLSMRRTDNSVISSVRMTGQQIPGSADGNCIVVSGSSTPGDNCTGILISGCDMTDAARFGVRAVRGQKIQVVGNKVRQSQRESINLDTCSDSLVSGNEVKGSVIDFTYCIRATNCAGTIVNNNIVEGNGDTAQTGNHGIGFVASSGACEDNTAIGNIVRGCSSAVIVTGTGVNHSVVVGNNGRNCYGATKFNITSSNQQVANNLI